MTLNRPFVLIAVDGGAASGKSSTSRRIAERFNLLHVDTGSHYRAITAALLKAGITIADTQAVAAFLSDCDLGTEIDNRSALIRLDGSVPQPESLRSPGVNECVSQVAAQPAVRQFLFAYQRSQPQLARRRGFAGLIMEGRDIGSVIFPDADLRLFLEADPATRAARRAAEGQSDAIAERDAIDTTRKQAPLKCPEGATRIDSSTLTLEQVVDQISNYIRTLQTRKLSQETEPRS